MDLGNITLILVLRFCIFWTYTLPTMLHALDTRRYGIYCKNKKNLHCCGEQRLSKPSDKSKIKKGKTSQRKLLKQEWAQEMCFDVWFSVNLSNLMHLAMDSHFLKFFNFAFLPLKYEAKKNWGLCPKSKGGGSLILDIVLFFTASFLCFIMFDWRL